MLILIDGYNVIAPSGPPARRASNDWLNHQRQRLIQLLAGQLGPELAKQTTIVFDAAAAPRGLESRFVQLEIEVVFAVNYPEADDLIEELIAAHATPKRLTVVSSDHRIQVAARRRGSLAVDSEPWLDRLADGRVQLAIAWPPTANSADVASEEAIDSEKPAIYEKRVSPKDVADWLKEFGIDRELPSDSRKNENPFHDFPDGYGDDLL